MSQGILARSRLVIEPVSNHGPSDPDADHSQSPQGGGKRWILPQLEERMALRPDLAGNKDNELRRRELEKVRRGGSGQRG